MAICTFFARESVIDKSYLEMLLLGLYTSPNSVAQPFKLYHIKRANINNITVSTTYHFKDCNNLPVVEFGDIIIASLTNLKNIKSSIDNDSNLYPMNDQFQDNLIIEMYNKNGRNPKDTFKSVGGNSIVYDKNKDFLYITNLTDQISQGYIRGIGYFLHTDWSTIKEIIFKYTSCSRDAVNLWEMWYSHPFSSGYVRQIDLQSGFMAKIPLN